MKGCALGVLLGKDYLISITRATLNILLPEEKTKWHPKLCHQVSGGTQALSDHVTKA